MFTAPRKIYAKRVIDVDGNITCSFAGLGLKIDDAQIAASIVADIESFDRIEALEFTGNTMGLEPSADIAECLKRRRELKRLLWSDMFTGRLKEEIPPTLINLLGAVTFAGAKITELNMSDNAFGPNGVRGFEQFIRSDSFYSVKTLNLNNCGLGVTGVKMMCEALTESLHASQKTPTPLGFTTFVAGRNRLENEGISALALVFAEMGTLECISIPQNGINHPGITALADALTQNPNMRTLNLSDNTFTVRGSRAMAAALPHLQRLVEINFDDCLMRNRGAIAVFDALRTGGHRSLEVLRVCGNDIRRDALDHLRVALCHQKHFQTLAISGNQLGDAGKADVTDIMIDCALEHTLEPITDDEGSDYDEDEDEEDEDGEEELGGREREGDEDEDRFDEDGEWIDDEDDEEAGYEDEYAAEDDGGRRGGAAPLADAADLHRADAAAGSFGRSDGVGRRLPEPECDQPGPPTRPSAAAFSLENPDFATLQAWGIFDAPMHVLNLLTADGLNDGNRVVRLLIALGSLVTPRNEDRTGKLIGSIWEVVWEEYFEGGTGDAEVASRRSTAFNNELWCQLGLIKSENGRATPPANIYGILYALRYAIPQTSVPQSIVSCMSFMLTRERGSEVSPLRGNESIVDSLIETLNRCST